MLTFIIEGDGFLYKMCRGIVGTLVQVGQGKIVPGEIRGILARRDRRVAGMTAPAQGLVLWKCCDLSRIEVRKSPPQRQPRKPRRWNEHRAGRAGDTAEHGERGAVVRGDEDAAGIWSSRSGSGWMTRN